MVNIDRATMREHCTRGLDAVQTAGKKVCAAAFAVPFGLHAYTTTDYRAAIRVREVIVESDDVLLRYFRERQQERRSSPFACIRSMYDEFRPR